MLFQTKNPTAAKTRSKRKAAIGQCRAIVRELRAMSEPRDRAAAFGRLAKIAKFMERDGLTEREIGTPVAELDRLCASATDPNSQWIDVDLSDVSGDIPIIIGKQVGRISPAEEWNRFVDFLSPQFDKL